MKVGDDVTLAQLELELRRLDVVRVSWAMSSGYGRRHHVLLSHSHIIGVSTGRGDTIIEAVNSAIEDAERRFNAYLEKKNKGTP